MSAPSFSAGVRPLKSHREALVVVVSLPGTEAKIGCIEIVEPPASPELLLVDPVAAFDLPFLLGATGLDVPMPDLQRLHGQRKGKRKLLPVVPAES